MEKFANKCVKAIPKEQGVGVAIFDKHVLLSYKFTYAIGLSVAEIFMDI